MSKNIEYEKNMEDIKLNFKIIFKVLSKDYKKIFNNHKEWMKSITIDDDYLKHLDRFEGVICNKDEKKQLRFSLDSNNYRFNKFFFLEFHQNHSSVESFFDLKKLIEIKNKLYNIFRYNLGYEFDYSIILAEESTPTQLFFYSL